LTSPDENYSNPALKGKFRTIHEMFNALDEKERRIKALQKSVDTAVEIRVSVIGERLERETRGAISAKDREIAKLKAQIVTQHDAEVLRADYLERCQVVAKQARKIERLQNSLRFRRAQVRKLKGIK
jgi:hypothetical protein